MRTMDSSDQIAHSDRNALVLALDIDLPREHLRDDLELRRRRVRQRRIQMLIGQAHVRRSGADHRLLGEVADIVDQMMALCAHPARRRVEDVDQHGLLRSRELLGTHVWTGLGEGDGPRVGRVDGEPHLAPWKRRDGDGGSGE